MKPSNLIVFTTALLILVYVNWVAGSYKEKDKVLYKDLGTLHFHHGERTRSRRTRSVPQLVCLKGCQYPQPKAVQCTNAGWDGTSNLWKCKAHMDPPYVLDKVEIVCEGYNSPDDPFVTVGSCSLEYTVKQQKNASKIYDDPPVKAIPFILCVAVLIFLLYKICLKDDQDVRQNVYNNGEGPDGGPRPDDGHGPHMGWNIPGMNPRHRPGNAPNAPGYGFMPGTGACNNQGNADSGTAGRGGGGFWTGLATGGVLGYLAGNNRNRNTAQSSSFFGGGSSGGMFSSGGTESSYFGRGSTNEGSSGLFGSSEEEPSTSETVSTARYRQR